MKNIIVKLDKNNITKIENVRLGSDPEFFLRDKTTGKYISAVGLIGGSKDNPRFIKTGYGVQEDNVALELTLPPTNHYLKMYNDCMYIIDFINNELQSKGLNIEVVNDGSPDATIFTDDELNTDAAREFGCSPSMNAWNLEVNPRPCATDSNLRSIGGHLHVSYNNMNYETSINLLRILDLYLTVPSILINTNGSLRRQLYGKAGEHRIGGVTTELRTLGQFWFQSANYVKWVFDNTFAAIEACNNGFIMDQEEEDSQAIINCINNNDAEIAEYLCDKYNINYTISAQEVKIAVEQ
jgi:hypothetical protein